MISTQVTELWTEAYDTQNEPVAALYLSHIVKRDEKGRRGALIPNPKALNCVETKFRAPHAIDAMLPS